MARQQGLGLGLGSNTSGRNHIIATSVNSIKEDKLNFRITISPLRCIASRTPFVFNSRRREHYSVTWNAILLLSVFLIPFTVVVTLTGPAVAPGGTLVSIPDFDMT